MSPARHNSRFGRWVQGGGSATAGFHAWQIAHHRRSPLESGNGARTGETRGTPSPRICGGRPIKRELPIRVPTNATETGGLTLPVSV